MKVVSIFGRTGLLLAAVAVSLIAPQPTAAADPASAGTTVKPGDWEVLFAGKHHKFRGYKIYDLPRKSWKVEKGELKSIPHSPQVDLISLSMYRDFELEVEWRIAPGGDGGILYRVMEDEGGTWHSGPEYQLLDDTGHPDGEEFNRTTGSLYDIAGARANRQPKPVGQYNVTVIKVRGTEVEHWLNGEKILSYDLASPQFRELVAKSKFKNLPRFGREREGHICLQHMGTEVAFRLIRIRRLDGLETAGTGSVSGK